MSGEKPTYKELEEKIAELESQLNYFARDRVNRQAKNSVFLDLFSRPEYYLQIYKELFPDDHEITLEDLQLVTIKNVLAIHPYNDLGILARDKLIVLVEAQSEGSVNVIFRLPEYYFDEMDYYIHTHHLDLHDKTKIEVPDVEAFIIYSGAGKVEKKTLSLKEEFFGGKDGKPDFTAQVICGDYKGGIIEEYIGFCRVFDEQRNLYPDDRSFGIAETVRICKERGYLVNYLDEHFAEVEKIMLLAYEPRNVRAAQERSSNIYAAIHAYKKMGADNARIRKEISEDFEITPTYAQNYIDTVEKEERERSLAK